MLRVKRGQPNDTWGRCVPVEHLERFAGARRTQVWQMSLLPGEGAGLRGGRRGKPDLS